MLHTQYPVHVVCQVVCDTWRPEPGSLQHHLARPALAPEHDVTVVSELPELAHHLSDVTGHVKLEVAVELHRARLQTWHRREEFRFESDPQKIAIWMSKNCQKLDIFSKKMTKIVIFSTKLNFEIKKKAKLNNIFKIDSKLQNSIFKQL